MTMVILILMIIYQEGEALVQGLCFVDSYEGGCHGNDPTGLQRMVPALQFGSRQKHKVLCTVASGETVCATLPVGGKALR